MPHTPIYLDYAAATPLDERVAAAMQPYFSTQFFNPSATYLSARRVAADLESARGTIAHWFGCRSAEVLFTAGGTEANNLAVQGIMSQYPAGNIVVSAIEHESVLAPAAKYERRIAPVDAAGLIDIAALVELIDEQTVLVSVMYANNEVGTVQPLKDIARLLKEKRKARTNGLPLYFHSDACQAGNYLDVHVSRLGLDLLTINGSKLYGPKQSGALYVAAHVELSPLILGGGQERNLRSGTENVAQCIGLAEALNIAQTMRHVEAHRLRDLQDVLINTLQVKCPTAIINGSLVKRLCNNMHITIPGNDNERLLMELDETGIMAAAGSACGASNEEPSHVLRAMGITDELAQSSLRLTMGRQTIESDVRFTVETLAAIVR